MRRPQNVFVMRDIACAGYVAGGNCLFFGRGAKGDLFGAGAAYSTAIGSKQVGTYDAGSVRKSMQDRLAFVNSVGAKYASMLAFPMFEAQMDSATSSLDTVMSVTSRLLPWEVNGTGSQGMHSSFPGGHGVWQLYKDALQLHTVHVSRTASPPFLAYSSSQATYDPSCAFSLARVCAVVLAKFGEDLRAAESALQPPNRRARRPHTHTHTHTRKDAPTPSVLRVLPFFVARRPGFHFPRLHKQRALLLGPAQKVW